MASQHPWILEALVKMLQTFRSSKCLIDRSVEMIALKDLSTGDELQLNYGDKSLRDFVQSYCFVPQNHGHEVQLQSLISSFNFCCNISK